MQHDAFTTEEVWAALAARRCNILPLSMRPHDHTPLVRSIPYPICASPARHVRISHG